MIANRYARILATLALILTSRAASAQLNTTFIPGLGADSVWWTRQNTVGRLSAQVNLGHVILTRPNTLGFVIEQADTVAKAFATSGQHILVAHSLGGIVAREAAYFYPGHATGILTIATPHHGARVADNRVVLGSYITSVADAILDALARLTFGVSALVSQLVFSVLGVNGVSGLVSQILPVNQPAVLDARSISGPVQWNVDNPDNLAHAAVYGTLDRRFAWMKVSASIQNGSSAAAAGWKNVYVTSMSVMKTCQLVRRLVIVANAMAHSCGRAYNAMASFDERWQYYTAGSGVASDGWIANPSSAYPGTSLADQSVNRQVQGVDHNELISHQSGINAMAFQMKNRLGMSPPP